MGTVISVVAGVYPFSDKFISKRVITSLLCLRAASKGIEKGMLDYEPNLECVIVHFNNRVYEHAILTEIQK